MPQFFWPRLGGSSLEPWPRGGGGFEDVRDLRNAQVFEALCFGRKEEARTRCEEILRENPSGLGLEDIHWHLAILVGKSEKGLAHVEKSLRLRPTMVEALLLRSFYLS